jgi:hypothetical protein
MIYCDVQGTVLIIKLIKFRMEQMDMDNNNLATVAG